MVGLLFWTVLGVFSIVTAEWLESRDRRLRPTVGYARRV